MDTKRETSSHHKMSCQRMFGKDCYWGPCKRKQILSVTPVTEKREQKEDEGGLTEGNILLAGMAASLS